MEYINKQDILNAYRVLSSMSPEPNLQGATQKVSAIRYFIALDMFCHKKGVGECSSREKNDKELFENYVGQICSVQGNLYTTNFYYPLKNHNGDYNVGSNFYSAGQVKASLVNPTNLFNYPKRSNAPLLRIRNGVLIKDLELYQNINSYIETDKVKAALVIWITRNVGIVQEGSAFVRLQNTLEQIVSSEMIDLLMPDTENYHQEIENLINNPLSASLSQLTEKDIAELFSIDTMQISSIDNTIPLQVIYYGAPGTGKSYKIKSLEKGKGTKPIRTTFHPDSDYSTFVGAYKPTMEKKEDLILNKESLISEFTKLKELGGSYPTQKFGARYWSSLKQLSVSDKKDILNACGMSDNYTVEFDKGAAVGEEYFKSTNEAKIVYNFVPQAFLKAYVQAWAHYPEPQYLVIEEINRGNCAQIFGDLFQLLDRSGTGFSEYPIAADSDISKYLCETFETTENFAPDDAEQEEINALYKDEYDNVMQDVKAGELLLLPKNLHILATMNTSDQSLFPIDSAFKRRWEWEYVPIRNAEKGWVIIADGKQWDWWTFLKNINNKIGSVTDSEDKKLGYFFVRPHDEYTITADTFVSKVVFYLWNDVFKDYGFSDDEFQTADGKSMTFPMFYETETKGQRVNEALVAHFLLNVAGKPLIGEETDSIELTEDEKEEA